MKPLAGWRLGYLTVGEVNDGSVSVSVTATKNSGNDTATVYFAQGGHDYGESFAAWPAKTEGVELAASGTVTATLALSDGNNCIRAFLLSGGEYSVSAPVFRRILAYGDYGTLTDVYEYIGTDNNLGDPANWAKDTVALAAEAPPPRRPPGRTSAGSAGTPTIRASSRSRTRTGSTARRCT